MDTSMDRERLEDIWFYCTRAKLLGVKEFDASDMEREVEALKKKGHTGPVCLSLGDELDPRIEWLLLIDGEAELVFFEAGFDDHENLLVSDSPEFDSGTMEVFEFSENQLSEVKDILNPPRIKDSREAGCLSTLADVRELLEQMFGEDLADRIMKKQFRTLNIAREDLTCVDIRMVVDSLIEGVFREFVGPQKAKEAAEKFDAYFRA
jgi:hypothetical protein